MPGEAEKLSKTFQIKEECEGFIFNLENLKSEGTVTAEVYSSLKSEYEQKLKASQSEVDRIRDEIKGSLLENLQEKEALADDLRKLEIKYRSDELSKGDYETARSELEGKITVLKNRCDELSELLEAKSSGDIAHPAEAIHAAPTEVKPADREVPTAKRFKLPSRRISMGIGAAVVLIIIIVVAVLLIPGGEEKQINAITIPVDIIGGNNIGSIHFELTYDTASLEPIDVVQGAVNGDALFEYDITETGKVIVGTVNSTGINGDGSITEITFLVDSNGNDNGPVTLILENVAAYSSMDLSRLNISATSGSFEPDDGSFVAPAIYFTGP